MPKGMQRRFVFLARQHEIQYNSYCWVKYMKSLKNNLGKCKWFINSCFSNALFAFVCCLVWVIMCVLPSSAQAPASQSPAGGWDSLFLTTVGNLHPTPCTIHPTPGIVALPVSSHIITSVGTCSWLVHQLVHDLFMTYLQHVHNLFTTCS